ncbi:MAG TPA: SoxR reducing system RseC family protein [Candidatus Limnocylindrales bacterium]|nr:SoxR reducing system RseC family protein [Candidatus Limnocylindrales bacterium]
MEQVGTIIEVNGDSATISLQRHLSCEGCNRCGILSQSPNRGMIVEALNPIGAKQGAKVLIETDDRQVLFLSFMLYIVPLAGLVSGIVLWLNLADNVGLVNNQELVAVAVGFGLMALIYMFIRAWDRRIKDHPKYKPVITSLIAEEETEC